VNTLFDKTGEAGRRIGRPTLRDASLKNERLMTVATHYFVQHGFDGATIDAIAQAADMGKQAFYTRFTDKERLFNAVIQRLKEKAVFTEMPSDDGSPLADGLPRRIRAILEDANRPYSMTVSKLAIREGRRFPELVPLMLEGTAERFTRPLAAYLEERKAAGEVREIDTMEAATMCIDLILAEVMLSICTDIPISEPRIEACAGRIANFALRGIAAA
jgi:TetR/AcrR family transcriptional repressor of mexJK operon